MSDRTVLPLDGSMARCVFRAVLDAFANPGRIERIAEVAGPHGPAVAWPVLALADLEVSLAVTGTVDGFDADALGSSLIRATGARRAASIVDADMVVLANGPSAETLASCRVGSAEEPERGARIIAGVRTIGSLPADGPRASVWVSGPGAALGRRVDVGGVEPTAIEELGRINAAYPAGIDLLLVAPDGAIVGIPRSCRVEVVAEVS